MKSKKKNRARQVKQTLIKCSFASRSLSLRLTSTAVQCLTHMQARALLRLQQRMGQTLRLCPSCCGCCCVMARIERSKAPAKLRRETRRDLSLVTKSERDGAFRFCRQRKLCNFLSKLLSLFLLGSWTNGHVSHLFSCSSPFCCHHSRLMPHSQPNRFLC